MAEYVTVANIAEIAKGKCKLVQINGKEISVWRVEDSFFAIDDICTHEEENLSNGEIIDTFHVNCPRHGAEFDLRSGKALCLPATEPVQVYQVRLSGEDVQILV